MEDEATEEWNRLYDHGNYLLREKYRAHTDRILDEVKFIGDQFDQDPQNKSFAASVEKLFKDLGNDENGKPAFKSHLLKDVKALLTSRTLKSLHFMLTSRADCPPSLVQIAQTFQITASNDDISARIGCWA